MQLTINKKRHIFSIIILLAFIFISLSACKSDAVKNIGSDDNNEITGEQEKADSNGVSENENVSGEINYYKNITEELNYDGYNFVIFTYEFATWPTYVDVEEMDGEVLNDAAYMRNLEVSELLGVEISAIKRAPETMVKTTVYRKQDSARRRFR